MLITEFTHSLMFFLSTLVPVSKATFPSAPFHPSYRFQQFSDPLPIPERILINGSKSQSASLTLRLVQFQGKLHSDLPDQPLWGYNGSMPGPLIEVEKDQPLQVHYQNRLPPNHLFPEPKGMSLAVQLGLCLPNQPDVRTVTHLHGAEVKQESTQDRLHNNDGWPDAWITPGQEQIAEYPNHQSARTLWYHDHAMGTTGRNVAAGLFGMYVIHDNYERSLGLPSGKYEVPLMLQSHALTNEGLLKYTDDIGVEHYGNTVSVNGRIFPYLDVEPRKYRFRIANASNARTYGLKLLDEKENPGPPFYQIGSDSGFLEKTVLLNSPSDPLAPRLVIAPGERADLIIDFSQYAGKQYVLNNNSRDAGDGEISIPEIMRFNVLPSVSEADQSRLPTQMRPIPKLAPSSATVSRRIVLDQTTRGALTMLTLNGKMWNDPVEEKPKLGSTEIWEIVDNLPDIHPFHLHLVQFQVLDRTRFDAEAMKQGQLVLTGNPMDPDENEKAWKDTIKVYPGTVTRIIVKFQPYTGNYVYHCHILEHEDMDMMRPFQVVP